MTSDHTESESELELELAMDAFLELSNRIGVLHLLDGQRCAICGIFLGARHLFCDNNERGIACYNQSADSKLYVLCRDIVGMPHPR